MAGIQTQTATRILPERMMDGATRRHKHLSAFALLLASGHMRNDFLWALALLAWPAVAAEHKFDFAEVRENQAPPGFRSIVTGEGKPGDWRVIMDEVPPLLQSLSRAAPAVAKQAVLAQLAQDPTDV